MKRLLILALLVAGCSPQRAATNRPSQDEVWAMEKASQASAARSGALTRVHTLRTMGDLSITGNCLKRYRS